MDGALRETWETGGHEIAVAVDDHNNLPDAITQSLVDILTREFPDEIFDIIDVDEERQQHKACRLRNQHRTVLQIFQSPAEGVYMAKMDVPAVIDVVTSGTFVVHLKHQDELLWVAAGGTSKQGIVTLQGGRRVKLLRYGVKNVRFVGPFGMHKYDMLVPTIQWKEMVRTGFIDSEVTVKGKG